MTTADIVFSERIMRARIAAMEEAKPFADLIYQIRVFERPSYLLKEGQLVQIDDGLTHEQRMLITKCESSIAEIHDRVMYRLKAEIGNSGSQDHEAK